MNSDCRMAGSRPAVAADRAGRTDSRAAAAHANLDRIRRVFIGFQGWRILLVGSVLAPINMDNLSLRWAGSGRAGVKRERRDEPTSRGSEAEARQRQSVIPILTVPMAAQRVRDVNDEFRRVE